MHRKWQMGSWGLWIFKKPESHITDIWRGFKEIVFKISWRTEIPAVSNWIFGNNGNALYLLSNTGVTSHTYSYWILRMWVLELMENFVSYCILNSLNVAIGQHSSQQTARESPRLCCLAVETAVVTIHEEGPWSFILWEESNPSLRRVG